MNEAASKNLIAELVPAEDGQRTTENSASLPMATQDQQHPPATPMASASRAEKVTRSPR